MILIDSILKRCYNINTHRIRNTIVEIVSLICIVSLSLFFYPIISTTYKKFAYENHHFLFWAACVLK